MEPLRIVIVEDDVDTRDYMAEVLTSCGHTATICPTMVGAVSYIREVGPDVAILDLRLHGNPRAGREVFDQLQGDPLTVPIRVILCSASGDPILQAHAPALEAAGGGVLAKPFRLADIQALLTRLTSSTA